MGSVNGKICEHGTLVLLKPEGARVPVFFHSGKVGTEGVKEGREHTD